jgi:CelD/BcsL family acetyltransferase involved in cellulose biosynthesis
MDLVAIQDDRQWDELLAAQPGRSLYHTTEWLKFQAGQFGFELHRLAFRDGTGFAGVFPVFVTRRAVFRVAASPRGVDYLNLGPLIAPELIGAALDAYERWARARRVGLSAIAFMSEIDVEAARRRGYRCERHLTALTDLRGGEDAVLARCKPACRKRIRKARRMGVTVAEANLSPHLDRYLEWSNRTYAKRGERSPLTRTVLRAMLDALGGAGRLLSLAAEAEGEVIGMYVVGHFGKTAYSLDIVADYDKLHYPAGNLMTWHALQWCCRQGIETFDFGGARMPSIARFKKTFGAEIVPYSNITKAHGPAARLALWLKDAAGRRIQGFRSRRARMKEPAGGSRTGAD